MLDKTREDAEQRPEIQAIMEQLPKVSGDVRRVWRAGPPNWNSRS
jgi:hypothetical protein